MNHFKTILFLFLAFFACLKGFAGTVTVSATGLSGNPIFVTSTLSSLTVGTELRIGTFGNTTALNNIISTYKAGVVGTGTTTALAQADADAKKSTLYNDTVTWLSSSSNFSNFVASASSITQTGTTASGKFLFNNTATRTVNSISGSYAGANGTFVVDYSVFGTNSQLWAWYATGTEIAVVTDALWVVPTNNASGLTISTLDLTSKLASELVLATYTDYASGSDLVSSVGIAQTLNVIPEPSSSILLVVGLVPLLYAARSRKFLATKNQK